MLPRKYQNQKARTGVRNRTLSGILKKILPPGSSIGSINEPKLPPCLEWRWGFSSNKGCFMACVYCRALFLMCCLCLLIEFIQHKLESLKAEHRTPGCIQWSWAAAPTSTPASTDWAAIASLLCFDVKSQWFDATQKHQALFQLCQRIIIIITITITIIIIIIIIIIFCQYHEYQSLSSVVSRFL